MLDYTEKRKVRNVLYSKPAIVVIAFLTLLAARGAWGMYGTFKEADMKRDKAEAELAALLKREEELRRDIERLSSVRGIEAEIRERYMVAKEGEKVMMIVGEEEVRENASPVPPEKSWWRKFLAAAGLEE